MDCSVLELVLTMSIMKVDEDNEAHVNNNKNRKKEIRKTRIVRVWIPLAKQSQPSSPDSRLVSFTPEKLNNHTRLRLGIQVMHSTS